VKLTSAHQPPDLSSLCLAIAEHAPLPMATVEGVTLLDRVFRTGKPESHTEQEQDPWRPDKTAYVHQGCLKSQGGKLLTEAIVFDRGELD